MSKFSDFLKNIKSDDVKYLNLNQIASISTGKLNANAMVEDGKYAFFTCDAKPFKIDNYAFDGEAILISGNGSQVGHLNYYVGKFNAYQRTYVLMNFIDDIIPKYLYHYLSTFLKRHIDENSKKGSVPYMTLPMLKNFKVAIPPLEIQKEYVKIFDKYCDLQEILNNEIEESNKQFEYYKSKMMFANNNFCKISELATSQKQKNKTKEIQRAYSITQRGLMPTSEYFGERTNITSADTSGYYIVKKGWFVYSPSRIDVGSISYLKEQDSVIVSPIDVVFSIDEEKIDNDFLLYYLLSPKGMSEIIFQRQGIEGTGRKNLPFEKFSKIEIPLPSLSEQKIIVSRIKQFDNYINNTLKEKRNLYKQQYEYYRNKLLSFEKLCNE